MKLRRRINKFLVNYRIFACLKKIFQSLLFKIQFIVFNAGLETKKLEKKYYEIQQEKQAGKN